MTKQPASTRVITLLRKGCVGLIAIGSAINISVGGEALAPPPTHSVDPQVTVTASGLLVDWRAPEAQDVLNADGSVGVFLPGYAQSTRPGAPQLPYTAVIIAVPPGATPTLQVVLVEEKDRPLLGPLTLAPFPEGVQRDAHGHVIGGAFSSASSMQPFESNTGAAVVLETVGVARGVRLARLVFYPARPIGDYPQTLLRVTTHVRAALTFTGQDTHLPRVASSDPLLAILRSQVINPEHVQPAVLTMQNPPATSQPNIQNSGAAESAWVVQVTTPGLTAITYEALDMMGFPVSSADPRFLHLSYRGSEIATEWDGDGDASFEMGERLLFYANPRFSRWTTTDAYILWEDNAHLPLRVQNRPAAPMGKPVGSAWVDETAEVNRLYTPDCFCGSIPPGRNGDRWTWDDLRHPGQSTASYTITLPMVDAAQPATLTVWLIGYTNVAASPDHRVDVELNGAPVGRIEWDGKQAITATLPIPSGNLHNGVNTLILTLPGILGVSVEGAWLDGFSIRHARGSAPFGDSLIFTGQPAPIAYTLTLNSATGLRVYDVTSPDHPLHLTDVITVGNTITISDPLEGGLHRYALAAENGLLFPTALRPMQPLQTGSGFLGADYVLITPPDFIPALDDLITLRQAQGLTVAVESVQAIYDAYGDGRVDPAAIRAYLAHAYATWTPRPVYVVLVGDGSFDPRKYRSNSPPTFIPPYLADVDPWAGETAADNRYVTVDGSDILPDMLIGRLPVKTFTETIAAVKKIVQYETKPFPGGWNKHVTLVADNTDEAGNFAAASEVIATTYVTMPFAPQRIYYTPPSTLITTTQQAVLEHWNAGALIIQYAGHSSWKQWAVEQFLHLDDLPTLHNNYRLPILVEMTCFTGAFHRPEPTLDEELFNLNGAGVVSVWGATGLGVSTGHSILGAGFFRAVFSDTVSTLGQATWAGKLSLATAGTNLDLIDTFTLLGDPALQPNRTIVPWVSRTYLPIMNRLQNTLVR